MPQFTPIEIPPGVVSFATGAKRTSNWREANLVRWSNGKMMPLGPWEAISYGSSVSTTLRAVHQWRDNYDQTWTAYLTEDDVYVANQDGGITSINSVTDPLSTYSSSLTSGGYSDGPYSDSTYGTARSGTPPRLAYGPCFTLDNWGEELRFMTSADGRYYGWVPPAPGNPIPKAALIAGAPGGARTFVVTPERHVIIFGVDDAGANPSAYAWCDKEDDTNWNFASLTSQAGTLPVEPASPVVAAKHAGDAGTVFFTLRHAYVSRYIGVPYIYNHFEIEGGSIPLSSASLVRGGDKLYWPSRNGWWSFGGVIQPVDCPIWSWIDDNIDWDSANLYASCIHLAKRSEIWFSFPTHLDSKNHLTAIYNYREGWWSQGKFGRTAGFGEDLLLRPVMVNGTTFYQHESGSGYPDASEGLYLETFNINSGNGALLSKFRQLMPEIEGSYADLRYKLFYKGDRTPNVEKSTPAKQLQSQSGCVDFLQEGRDFRLRMYFEDVLYRELIVGTLMVDSSPIGAKIRK